MAEISVTTEKEGLGFNLQVSNSGALWTFSLLVRNQQPKVRIMAFRSGKLVDFAVEKEGRVLWQWSAGRMFTQAMVDKKLGQNDTLGPYVAQWNGQSLGGEPLGEGQYQLKAYFLGLSRTDPVLETTITI